MSILSTVRVELGANSYPVHIGSGLLDDAETYLRPWGGDACAIVTNETVGPLYAGRLSAALKRVFHRVHIVVVADGESHKDWLTLQRIFDGLLASGCDRTTTLLALGGGVIGDLAGFAAACYMRGVRYVQVPTTLLSQVDSSVGGKTAINHPLGKNLIGAFHQPCAVLADVDTLATLPRRELIAGLAEVIKYGAVSDDSFLAWIESHVSELHGGSQAEVIRAVTRSCEIKAGVVALDEREAGARAILNFGHTFAHAIETGTGHGTWLHGEAVGCGMAMAADLSARLGLIERSHSDRIARLVEAAGLPVRAPAVGTERYLELMRMDKKAQGGKMRFVLLEGPGQAVLRGVDEALVAATIEHFSV